MRRVGLSIIFRWPRFDQRNSFGVMLDHPLGRIVFYVAMSAYMAAMLWLAGVAWFILMAVASAEGRYALEGNDLKVTGLAIVVAVALRAAYGYLQRTK